MTIEVWSLTFSGDAFYGTTTSVHWTWRDALEALHNEVNCQRDRFDKRPAAFTYPVATDDDHVNLYMHLQDRLNNYTGDYVLIESHTLEVPA